MKKEIEDKISAAAKKISEKIDALVNDDLIKRTIEDSKMVVVGKRKTDLFYYDSVVSELKDYDNFERFAANVRMMCWVMEFGNSSCVMKIEPSFKILSSSSSQNSRTAFALVITRNDSGEFSFRTIKANIDMYRDYFQFSPKTDEDIYDNYYTVDLFTRFNKEHKIPRVSAYNNTFFTVFDPADDVVKQSFIYDIYNNYSFSFLKKILTTEELKSEGFRINANNLQIVQTMKVWK